ncbi:SRPBCC family protein [Baekduia sp. Peel2402]|uniref:SRPBCC family protein n=1 Tax=Baekduia sp. Peel2402 TaxID=3458296 RepID=UPI00403E6A32
MLRYDNALTAGSEAIAWDLLARPERWHEWAPHLRGAWGLSEDATGEVRPGARGAVRLLGAVPVPVVITAKDATRRSWSWRVAGVVDMDHRVEPGRVVIEIRAPRALEAALGVTYGPLVELLLKRLSRSAAAQPRPTGTGTPAG